MVLRILGTFKSDHRPINPYYGTPLLFNPLSLLSPTLAPTDVLLLQTKRKGTEPVTSCKCEKIESMYPSSLFLLLHLLYPSCSSFAHLLKSRLALSHVIGKWLMYINDSHICKWITCEHIPFIIFVSPHVNLSTSSCSSFSTNFSKSMINQDMIYDTLSYFGLLKRMNGLDYENRAHKSPKWQILRYEFRLEIWPHDHFGHYKED